VQSFSVNYQKSDDSYNSPGDLGTREETIASLWVKGLLG
jgi:hypothetical protein